MKKERRLELSTRGPFQLDATVRLLQRRPTNLVDLFENDRHVRLFETASGPVLAITENVGTVDGPKLVATLRGPAVSVAVARQLESTLRRMLGLEVDPAVLSTLGSIDQRLAPTVRALRGLRPPRFPDLFEAFANVIPFQQVSLDAGVAAVRRLVERFSSPRDLDGRRFYPFPRAERVASARVETVRATGLSGAKAQALHGIARRIADGELREEEMERLPTSEAMRRLVELPGIGPWSAGLLLLRGFGRLDSFPTRDVGVARGLASVLGIAPGTPFDQASFAARFGDAKGLLYFLSLGSQLLGRGLIRPAEEGSRRQRRT